MVGSELVELIEELDRLEARIVATMGAFDASGEYELDGSRSPVTWLSARTKLTEVRIRSWLRRSRFLEQLPAFTEAWCERKLTGGQIDIVAAHLDRELVPVMVEQQAGVVGALMPLDLDDTTAAMREWRQRADALVDRPVPTERPNELHHLAVLGDSFFTRGHWDADAGNLIEAALSLAMAHDDVPDDGIELARTWSQRRADALLDIVSAFLNTNADTPPTSRQRPHINVVINLDDLPTGRHAVHTANGMPLTRHEIQRLLCDCALHRVLTAGDSTIVDYGRSTRTVAGGLWHALQMRDRHCRFPHCDRPAHWCDAHHTPPWEHGGTTDLAHLVLLCRRHHRTVHKPGWCLDLERDGTVRVTSPDGETRTTHPPGLRQPLLT